VSIEIRDINDHEPVFAPAELVHELSESSQPGTTSFVIPTAEDGDSPPLAVQQYLIRSDNDDADDDSQLFRLKVNVTECRPAEI